MARAPKPPEAPDRPAPEDRRPPPPIGDPGETVEIGEPEPAPPAPKRA